MRKILTFAGLLFLVTQAQAQPYIAGEGSGGQSAAALSVKVSDLEEQIRLLRGTVEELQHRQTRLENDNKSLNEDIDFRMRALEEKSGTGIAPADATNGAEGTAAPSTSGSLTMPPAGQPAPETLAKQQGTAAPVETMSPPVSGDQSTFATSKEHYDHAFKLMNQAKYAEAGALLESFVQRYPKDTLTGNVYYWLGETYYVREDYLKSADNFRQGFEAMPDGVKAPDNLFKLALSLNMLNKKRESCVVLKQLQIKYQGQTTPVLQKAAAKEKELGCVR